MYYLILMPKKFPKSKYYITGIFFLSMVFFVFSATAFEPRDLKIELPEQELSVSNDEVSVWFTSKPFLIYSPENLAQIENIDFCPDSKIICALTLNQRKKYSIRKVETQTYNKSKIEIYLEKIAEKYNKPPVNASFLVENDKVSTFSLSQDGYALNKEKSIEEIIHFISQEKNESNKIKLVFNNISPEVKENNAENMGIRELIGEGKSNFTGSTASRIHNIKVATEKFNGLLIKPDEEFSFVKNLGEVDGEHGYKQELVIKKGVTEPEFGGGICQVSTTAFRAAINTGLEITARRNHAYPVHYYAPQGMDAAVYIPNPDLRFKNNTPGYILIKTELNLDKKELIFKFYGTNDGRKVEIEGPKVLSREPDGAMKTVFYQKVTTKEGNILIDEDFKSNYKSPNDYPKPGEILTSKPKNWSNKEWEEYKKDNNL